MPRNLLIALSIFEIACFGCVQQSQQPRREPVEQQGADQSNQKGSKNSSKNKQTSGNDKVSSIDGSQGDDDPDDLTPDTNNPDNSDTSDTKQTSGGTGGPKGKTELRSEQGLSYIINAPEENNAQTAHGLLILLHGSGASNYRNFLGMMTEVTRKYDLIPVSVLAPNQSGWNETNQTQAAAKLQALIQEELLKKYNINLDHIFFSGQSSGAGFLSSHFVSQYASEYHGGAFLLCGAAPPAVSFNPSEDTKTHFKLHFEITSGDPIWPQYYAQATRAYENAGMSVSKDNTKRGGHCAFDQQQVILDHIDKMLTQ